MAGEITITVNRSANIGGQQVGGTPEALLADAQVVYQQTIANGAVDYEIDLPIDITQVKVAALHSTRALDIYTNQHHDSTTPVPDQHISLLAGTTRLWTANDPTAARVFTTNVTTLFCSNASGQAATLTVALASQLAPTGDA